MLRAALLAIVCALAPLAAAAQQVNPTVVPTCGTVPAGIWVPGGQAPQTVDTSGRACGNATVAVSPSGVTSTQTTFVIGTGGTFQSIAAANTARKSCLIQNTSGDTLDVFFGATANATAAKSFQVPASGTLSCANVNGTTLTDNIAVTTSTTADTGVLNLN